MKGIGTRHQNSGSCAEFLVNPVNLSIDRKKGMKIPKRNSAAYVGRMLVAGELNV